MPAKNRTKPKTGWTGGGVFDLLPLPLWRAIELVEILDPDPDFDLDSKRGYNPYAHFDCTLSPSQFSDRHTRILQEVQFHLTGYPQLVMALEKAPRISQMIAATERLQKRVEALIKTLQSGIGVSTTKELDRSMSNSPNTRIPNTFSEKLKIFLLPACVSISSRSCPSQVRDEAKRLKQQVSALICQIDRELDTSTKILLDRNISKVPREDRPESVSLQTFQEDLTHTLLPACRSVRKVWGGRECRGRSGRFALQELIRGLSQVFENFGGDLINDMSFEHTNPKTLRLAIDQLKIEFILEALKSGKIPHPKGAELTRLVKGVLKR